MDSLEVVAENTWRDMTTWHTLEKLVAAQRKSVSNTRAYIRQLAIDANFTRVESNDPLLLIIESLIALEKTIAKDFRSRGQVISDLVNSHEELLFSSLTNFLLDL